MFALALAISILPLLEAALITWSHYKVTHARQDVLSYCPTLLPRHKSLNARKMVRVAGVEPAWTCAQDMWVAATLHPDLKRGPCSPPCSALHAYHLSQRVHNVHQVALRLHHGVDALVRHRRFVNDIRILTALDPRRRLGVVIQGEAALRLGSRHGTSGSMTTAHEALRIALAAHDV